MGGPPVGAISGPRRANVIEFGAAGRVCAWARLIVFAARGIEACEVAAGTVEQVETKWSDHLGPRRTGQRPAALQSLREITDPYA